VASRQEAGMTGPSRGRQSFAGKLAYLIETAHPPDRGPVTYFFDDDAAAQIADQIAQVSAWRDTEARHIAERVVQLNPRDRNTVTNLIDTLRAYDEQPRSNRRRRKPSTSDSA
jgi:hypothetical protein